ncbi:uncharacterized protein LOC141614768 [Silene latifolia]|uniref:uncharacterized protein LOC141614768 n=1 Tax=Silene latifolia TaxID=37657 RepID=UPI003D7731DD
MSVCLNLSRPYKMSNNNEEHEHNSSLEKKGIVSILCSDFSNPKISSSLNNNINININNTIKRSMSAADMSSQKWQQTNEFPLKRLQSSDHLQSLVEEEENDKGKKVGQGGAAFEDIWSSILINKKTDGAGSGADPAPYVHPLVKRASSLSEKSLEICTESLGSETGSDGFSSPLSDHGEEHEVVDEEYIVENVIVRNNDYVDVGNKCSYNYQVKNNKKVNNNNGNGNGYGVVKSFPPPLLSLAHRDDGSNVEMRTRRQDGRLVVEAVSVPSRNCFRARREDGRLLLTLTNDNDNEDDEEEEFEDEDDEVVEDVGDDVQVSDGVVAKVANALTFVMEESEAASGLPKTRVINVHTASPMMIMTKLMELTSTRNVSSWPRTSNRTVITSLDEGDEDVLGKQVEVESKPAQKKVSALLPPRPRVSTAKTAADVLNAYEYYWRRSDSPTAAAVALLTPLAGKQSSAKGVVVSPQVVKDTNKLLLGHNVKGVPKGEVVLVKAETVGGEYLVPMLRGCKEPRRSLFFWEPFCIATS